MSILNPRLLTTGSLVAIGGAGYAASSAGEYNFRKRYSDVDTTNQDRKNMRIERELEGSTGAGMTAGASIGAIGALGATAGTRRLRSGAKLGSGGNIIGGVIGAVVGGVIGGAYGAFQSDMTRDTLTNKYVSNTDGSDVRGGTSPYSYNSGNPVLAGIVGGGGYAAMQGVNKFIGDPKENLAKKIGSHLTGKPAATAVGIGIASMMAISMGGTKPESNRIRGLGY